MAFQIQMKSFEKTTSDLIVFFFKFLFIFKANWKAFGAPDFGFSPQYATVFQTPIRALPAYSPANFRARLVSVGAKILFVSFFRLSFGNCSLLRPPNLTAEFGRPIANKILVPPKSARVISIESVGVTGTARNWRTLLCYKGHRTL